MLMGSPSEMPIIASIMADPNAPLRLIANTAPLDEEVALLTAAQAFIGNDSGLLNIAAACGRLAIGFFAQTEPLDYNANIIPVALPDDRFDEAGAIGRITPEQAFSFVAATLHRQGAAGAEQPVT
jgi:ADP-heptose:LPS heptosyltransferase